MLFTKFILAEAIEEIQTIHFAKPHLQACETKIETLGPALFDNPKKGRYVDDSSKSLVSSFLDDVIFYNEQGLTPPAFELAGPRQKIFFDPQKTKVGIVSCGGMCPGINAVIRGIYYASMAEYKIQQVIGYRGGYDGLRKIPTHSPLVLEEYIIGSIHEEGGSILKNSRGNQNISEMVDTLVRDGISILFTIGGDGTQHGALELTKEIKRRGLAISVIGIPKTIDNDILYLDYSFGFLTAVEKVTDFLKAAHNEATSDLNRGISLVKVMGRSSGYIAAEAALQSRLANFCLIPEAAFEEDLFFAALENRLANEDHAVILLAEGVLEDHLAQQAKDASGNTILGDVGIYLKEQTIKYLKSRKIAHKMFYLDPSYYIRGANPIPHDISYASTLGNFAVHAGMAGKTGIIVGQNQNKYVHIPIELSTAKRKKINLNGGFWNNVKEVTGQEYPI